MVEKRLLTQKEVAEMLGVSEGTVKNLVKDGSLPRARKVRGKLARWFVEDVEVYLNKLKYQEPPADPE